MDIQEAVESRRSVRRFLTEPVPRSDLERMVWAASWAPSGCNRQMWKFVIVEKADTIQWFGQFTGMGWVAKAPALVLFVLDPETEYWREDGSAAIQNLMLMAKALGYGTCWVQGQIVPHEEAIKKEFVIPPTWRVLAVVPVGRPEKWPSPPAKKPLSDVMSFDRF